MAEFLSAAWLRELDTAARASKSLAELGRDQPFVVEQRVVDTPLGEVAYHLTVDRDGARVTSGRAAAPDLVVVTDLATAGRLHRGDSNAQHAFSAGALKISGAVHELLRRRELLVALDDVFATVRSSTQVPSVDTGSGE